jgi:hypothetical protein
MSRVRIRAKPCYILASFGIDDTECMDAITFLRLPFITGVALGTITGTIAHIVMFLAREVLFSNSTRFSFRVLLEKTLSWSSIFFFSTSFILGFSAILLISKPKPFMNFVESSFLTDTVLIIFGFIASIAASSVLLVFKLLLRWFVLTVRVFEKPRRLRVFVNEVSKSVVRRRFIQGAVFFGVSVISYFFFSFSWPVIAVAGLTLSDLVVISYRRYRNLYGSNALEFAEAVRYVMAQENKGGPGHFDRVFPERSSSRQQAVMVGGIAAEPI